MHCSYFSHSLYNWLLQLSLLNLPAPKINRLRLVLNSGARAVTKTPQVHHITPILKSLNWFNINERMKYNVISLTTGQPSYLRSLLSFPSHRCTRSSYLVTLSPSLNSRLGFANIYLYLSAPVLWNSLSHLIIYVTLLITLLLHLYLTHLSDLPTSVFLKKLKTFLFHSSFPPQSVFT